MQDRSETTTLTHEKEGNLSFFQQYRQKVIELFTSNIERIQREVSSLKLRSNDYFNNIIKIVSTNNYIKNFLKTNKNYYTNYLFSYLGYKYQTNLDNPNFYHFVSQSWILNVFPNQTDQTTSSKQYSDILRDLINKEFEDLAIIQSLELITGTFSISDQALKASEVRLTNVFLRNLRDVINEFKKIEISKELTKIEFDKNIMNLLLRAVNFTINESEKIDSLKSLLLYDTFVELSSEKTNITLTNFIKKASEKRQSNNQDVSENGDSFTSACTLFFNFAKTGLIDLLYDLDLFNQQSKSILCILSDIFSRRKQNIQTILASLYNHFGNFLTNVSKEIRFENLKQFYEKFYTKLRECSESSVAVVKKKVNTYRDWVNSIDYVQDVLYYPHFFFEKASTYTIGSKVFLYERMYSPCKNVTLTITGDYYNFVLKNVENVRENANKIYESIKEGVGAKYYQVKQNFNQTVQYELQENSLLIKINKKQIEDIRSHFIAIVIEQLSLVKFQEKFNVILENTKGNALLIKQNLLEKYKNFFDSFNKNQLPPPSKIEDGKNEEEKDMDNKYIETVNLTQISEDMSCSQRSHLPENGKLLTNGDHEKRKEESSESSSKRSKKRKSTIK